jgi:hypothetical protein
VLFKASLGWFNHGWLRQLIFVEIFFDVFGIGIGLLVLEVDEILPISSQKRKKNITCWYSRLS